LLATLIPRELGKVRVFVARSVPPLKVIGAVAAPRPLLAAIETVPELRVVVPAYPFIPESLRVPLPDMIKPPVPFTAPLTVKLSVPMNVGEKPPLTILLNVSMVPLTEFPIAASDPSVIAPV
jgi:hypothetical protein